MTDDIDSLTTAVVVKNSSVHGRGVFAARPIRSGERFCTNHLFVLPEDEREFLDQTSLYDHYFEQAGDAFIAMGEVSFLNHDEDPNAEFDLDPVTLEIHLTARRMITNGEEVTIHYGTDPWW